VGSFFVVRGISHLKEHPGGRGQLPILACGEREAMVMAPPPTHDSAVSPCFHGFLAFLHCHFPPLSPSSHPLHLSAVNSSPRPGIAPQSLKLSSQPLCLPGDQHSCLRYVWQGLFDSHSTYCRSPAPAARDST